MGGENMAEKTGDDEILNRKFDSRAKFGLQSSSDNLDEHQVEKTDETNEEIKTETGDATRNAQNEVGEEKEILADGNESLLSEDSAEQKTTPVPISTELREIIEQNPDLFGDLEVSLAEKKDLFKDEEFYTDSESFAQFLIRFAGKSVIISLKHPKKEQSYIQKNLSDWKSFIESFLNEPGVIVIYTVKDCSKTYIFDNSTLSEDTIKSEISKFFNQKPIPIEVSPHVVEFMMLNEEFSDVKLLRAKKDGNQKCTLTDLRVKKLQKEMQNVKSQSFLLNEIQYESFSGEKKKFLREIENTFQLKANLYEYTRTAEIPVIFKVNPLTRISCVVSTEPENIPLDLLISIDLKERAQVEKTLELNNKSKYRIVQYESWNITLNRHIGVLAKEMAKKSYPWNVIIEDCFGIVLKDDSVSHTIGISIPAKISADVMEFTQSLVTVVENLPQNHERPMYILLFVGNDEIKLKMIEIMKKIGNSKTELPTSVLHEPHYTVDVISALITEVKVDAITCAVDHRLILSNGGVSSAILEKAGRKMQTYCSKNYPRGIVFPELAITAGYSLPCKHILLGALPSNDGKPNIETFMETCFEVAVNLGITSIAFPALGTGNLKYDPRHVAAAMESTIKKFMTKIKANTLQKIVIVIHPETKAMDPFFELKNKFDNSKGSKGAILKRTSETSQATQTNRLKYSHDPLQWIQFLNYSAKRETFEAAIKYFVKGLENVTVAISVEEAEELFYFYDLITLVPDIVKQLDSMQNSLLVPNNSATQFEDHLSELRTRYLNDRLPIDSEIKISELQHYLMKIRQQHPFMKCEITGDNDCVRFHGPNFDSIQAAKYQLECFLGRKKNITVARDRFDSPASSEPPQYAAAAMALPPAGGRNETVNTQNRSLFADSQNIEEAAQVSSSFTLKDGFLVKVYQGDILKSKVDGIVNAANRSLAHGAGLAFAIITAAGDVVDKEGKDKLRYRKLTDGDVLTTSAGNLTQYKCIIHAVGPMYSKYSRNDEYCRGKIVETVYNTLEEARKQKFSSVALPAISSAIFGVPIEICTDGYFKGLMEFCRTRPQSCTLKEVHFVDMDASRISAIKLHFDTQLKTTESTDAAASAEDFGKDSKQENPAKNTVERRDECPVCFEEKTNLNRLKCKHICCLVCVAKLSQPICPICRIPFDIVLGDQPDGTMQVYKSRTSLPGNNRSNTYEIAYSLYTGYDQTVRSAYLPMCEEGDIILKMLQLAFERRLIFTVGESRTSRQQNVITWNEIHHKTSRYNYPDDSFGYPDPNYFARVTAELATKGITPDSVSNRPIKKFIEIRSGKVVKSTDFSWSDIFY